MTTIRYHRRNCWCSRATGFIQQTSGSKHSANGALRGTGGCRSEDWTSSCQWMSKVTALLIPRRSEAPPSTPPIRTRHAGLSVCQPMQKPKLHRHKDRPYQHSDLNR
ncbi:MAG: hypothetical protein QOD39_2639 [Mycobacterium sp.]|nr:hypothetical protein [Mycobacterium sp.]